MKKIFNKIRKKKTYGIDNTGFESDATTERYQRNGSLPKPATNLVAEHSAEAKEHHSQVGKAWSLYTKNEKITYILKSAARIIAFIILLYLFLLSLNFMTIGFTLATPYALDAGPTIQSILSNPFAALAIGIIITAIMQNATATTSIAVAMVGAKIIPDVKTAVPIIMGSNIGTCMPNSLIALSIGGNPSEFKRAFSGATLNDGFNLLTTSILLTVEIASGFLNFVSEKIASALPFDNPAALAQANFIGFILNPVTDLFILLNTTAINAVSNGTSRTTEIALRCCDTGNITGLDTTTISSILNSTIISSTGSTSPNYTTVCLRKCTHWCMPMLESFGDGGTGLFWIIFSLIVLIACLFLIVRVLSDLVVGPIARGVQTAVNISFPGKFKWASEIPLFIISLLFTVIVQSSNIITATLVPLCGIGIISLQRVYTLTLGSNIGTTVTGILTAFTVPPSAIKPAMQLAFVYTLFNSLGVLFWLPIPVLRFPKTYARALGKLVLKYRWFVWVYILGLYLIIPAIVFGLAMIPYWIGLAIFGIPAILIIIIVILRLFLLKKFPNRLPEKLKNINWLPIWLRSLEPYDKKVDKLATYRCCKCLRKRKNSKDANNNQEQGDEDFVGDVPLAAFRRASVMEGLVEEARAYSRRNTLYSIEESDDDDDKSTKKSIDGHDNDAFTKQI